MDPELVMKDEVERMKYTHPKKRAKKNDGPENMDIRDQVPQGVDPGEGTSSRIDSNPSVSYKMKSVQGESKKGNHSVVASLSHLPIELINDTADQHEHLPRNILSPREMDALLCDTIQRNHILSLAEETIDTDIIAKVTQFQLHPNKNPLCKETMRELSQCYQRQFEAFAAKDPHFKYLIPTDQSILLSKNSPLLFHYHLARYLNADSGLDQLTWLLGPHAPSLSKTNIPLIT